MGGRFIAWAYWWEPGGGDKAARAVALTDDAGYFTFFDDSNIEIVVKVVDGCAVNGTRWVFVSGLTNLRTEIQVSDVKVENANTGGVGYRIYDTPPGVAFVPIQDVVAFPCD